jgi:bidirectional [NiFe] hydrogenase diaphorase subunit
MLCSIRINGRDLKINSGTNLLWAALDNGIDIPNLCSLKDMPGPPASCRLCYVEIAGRPDPVTACTEAVAGGMVVTTDSPRIERLRRFSFDLLLSRHHVNCGNCVKNRKCGLQQIARSQHFKILSKRFKKIETDLPVDTSHQQINFDPNKCILCGRCVYICHSKGAGVLDFAYRGIETGVSTFAGIPLIEAGCNSCLECVMVCPVGSLYKK